MPGTRIEERDLPHDLLRPAMVAAAASRPAVASAVEDERSRITAALQRTGGNRARAARLLGIGRATLYRRLAELGIDAGVNDES